MRKKKIRSRDKDKRANWGKKKFRSPYGAKGTPKEKTFRNAGKKENFKRRNPRNVAPLSI